MLAAVLALGAACGLWLYYGQPETLLPLASAGYLEEQAEQALEAGAAGRPRARALLRQALARDPASPYRWCTLAEVLADSGDLETARTCFRRAVELGPNLPPVRMRAANFCFSHGRTSEGLSETRRILELVRDYDEAVFSTWQRMGVSTAQALPSAARC